MASFTFNGLNSETDYDLRIHDVLYNVLPQTIDRDVKVPYGRGRYDYGTYLDANTIGFVCSLQGTSYSNVFTQVEAIAAWLNPELGVFKLSYSGKPNRYCYAKISGDTGVKQILLYGKFTVIFKIPEGVWYGDEVSWTSNETTLEDEEVGSIFTTPSDMAEGAMKAGLSGMTVTNLVYGKDILDGDSVNFVTISGDKYYESFTPSIITGDGGLKRVTNNSGTTVDINVIHLNSIGLESETDTDVLDAMFPHYIASVELSETTYGSYDSIFPIFCKAGVMDFSITNGDDVLWLFPDGTTSTANKPSKTLTANGLVFLFASNFSDGDISIDDNITNALYAGDLSDLPALTYTLILHSCPLVTGDLSDLPALTYYLSLSDCSLVTGDLSDLPALTYYLNLNNCSHITGDLSDLPALTYYLNLNNCSHITGDLSDLPALTYYLSLFNCSHITGDLSDLPALTYLLNLYNCSLVTGAYTAVSGLSVPTITNLYNTGLSAADMDSTLIAYAACTKTDGTFNAVGMTRTSASDAAVLHLTTPTGSGGLGWAVTGLTVV